jgi:hypothetical protein
VEQNFLTTDFQASKGCFLLVSTQLLFFSPEMGESAQLSFVPKISGEFLSIWAKFPQISKLFG